MKRIMLIFLSILLITGCGKKQNTNIIGTVTKKISNLNSYEIKGKLELFDDEDTYKYNITVSFLKDYYYNVTMINENNNQKQIILKNEEGLYVITPSLNKSFKFDSTWPDNSSQIYILSSLEKDIKSESRIIEKDGKTYIKTSVKYPNNPDLKYQEILIDNKNNIKEIKVYNSDDNVKMKFSIESISYKKSYNKDDFNIDNFIENDKCTSENCEEEKNVSKLQNAIYPIYIPDNTYLSSSEVIDTEEENRIILTFSGEKNYVLVEENVSNLVNHEITPIFGEPVMLNDTIAALASNSIYWTSNDVDYYLASTDLSNAEMVQIAASVTNAKTAMYTK